MQDGRGRLSQPSAITANARSSSTPMGTLDDISSFRRVRNLKPKRVFSFLRRSSLTFALVLTWHSEKPRVRGGRDSVALVRGIAHRARLNAKVVHGAVTRTVQRYPISRYYLQLRYRLPSQTLPTPPIPHAVSTATDISRRHCAQHDPGE